MKKQQSPHKLKFKEQSPDKLKSKVSKLKTSLTKDFSDQNYEDIIQQEFKFTDELFPPNNISLYLAKGDLSNNLKPSVSKFVKVTIKF